MTKLLENGKSGVVEYRDYHLNSKAGLKYQTGL
jgi:hypothetical protein